MFNSPLLDVTIGLVFIFLLYSLLVTSINEVIATLLSFRAKMLKRAIITGMLSNTSDDSRFMSIVKGIVSWLGIEKIYNSCKQIKKTIQDEYNASKSTFTNRKLGLFISIFKALVKTISKKAVISDSLIGNKFYEHPIISSYGSSRVYSLPSYISAKNFSSVLIDIIKEDFTVTLPTNNQNNPDIIKIKELIDYYYYNKIPEEECFLEREPTQILRKLIIESNYNIELFKQKVENWFNDTMTRVSGWYKRQTQFALFTIGLLIAVTFNVDTIKIAGVLSVDKDARDKLVQLAIVASEKYKDDPRIKKTITKGGQVVVDTSASDSLANKKFDDSKKELDSIKHFISDEIKSTNQIIAIGWGLDNLHKPFSEKIPIPSKVLLDSIQGKYNRLSGLLQNKKPKLIGKEKDDSASLSKELLKLIKDSIYSKLITLDHLDTITTNKQINIILTGQRHFTAFESIRYILKNMWKGTAWLGFLITAFAISLGAPFWFDLLNKLVKIRSAGKTEDNNASTPAPAIITPATISPQVLAQPQAPTTIINTNPQQKPGEEAAG